MCAAGTQGAVDNHYILVPVRTLTADSRLPQVPLPNPTFGSILTLPDCPQKGLRVTNGGALLPGCQTKTDDNCSSQPRGHGF